MSQDGKVVKLFDKPSLACRAACDQLCQDSSTWPSLHQLCALPWHKCVKNLIWVTADYDRILFVPEGIFKNRQNWWKQQVLLNHLYGHFKDISVHASGSCMRPIVLPIQQPVALLSFHRVCCYPHITVLGKQLLGVIDAAAKVLVMVTIESTSSCHSHLSHIRRSKQLLDKSI